MAVIELHEFNRLFRETIENNAERIANQAKILEAMLSRSWLEELVCFIEDLIAAALVIRHNWTLRMIAVEQLGFHAPTFDGIYGPREE